MPLMGVQEPICGSLPLTGCEKLGGAETLPHFHATLNLNPHCSCILLRLEELCEAACGPSRAQGPRVQGPLLPEAFILPRAVPENQRHNSLGFQIP